MTAHVLVNGKQRPLPAVTSLAELVAELSPSPHGVAVAVNEAVVPRSEWVRTQLRAGDRVEVLVASQGG